LTIQPLAENAVIHGITETAKPGTVKISTYSDEKNWYAVVEDDGIGFDDSIKIDTTKHLGVENVRARLKALVGGDLILSSKVGIGTKATVIIPKEKRQ